MRLTRAGEYAVRCVLYLARRGRGAMVSRKEIAGEADIPGQFLAKIAQQLARQGVIEILQGAAGGYRLLVEPREITLLEVIETIIGEISLNDCVLRPESCGNSGVCAVHQVWNQAQEQLRDYLRGVTFADLLVEEEKLSR
ncbi:MAG: Rrf2 family transcriptional regulator, partial [Desulfobulbaceae bacterium]|nr:Rrf2 family transcriptional regulator [Desulfobulbaceae bacterium]